MEYGEVNKNVSQRILKFVIKKSSEPDSIDLFTNISTMDLDSLDLVELIMDIEKEFDISIRDEDAEELLSRKKFNVIDIRKFLSDKYGVISIKEERKEKIIKINDKS